MLKVAFFGRVLAFCLGPVFALNLRPWCNTRQSPASLLFLVARGTRLLFVEGVSARKATVKLSTESVLPLFCKNPLNLGIKPLVRMVSMPNTYAIIVFRVGFKSGCDLILS